MPFDAHANFAISAVATAPSPATSGTSLVVTAGQGSRFPAVPFNATVWASGATPTPANAEIVRVTALSTDTLTIVRAQEGSTARTVVVGDQIMASITQKTLSDIETLLSTVIVETPESHGAVRNGSTDDTAAINAAISAAVTRGIASGNYYAEIWFSSGIYKVNGSLIQGGTTKGNAQITLPWLDPTTSSQKFILNFVFPSTGAAVEHWQQSAAQRGGTTLDSNLNASYSGTYGSPCVIGGPTPEQIGGGAVFSNLMFKVTGTLNVNMSNPTVVGSTSSTPQGNAVDLQRVAECDMDSVWVQGNIAWPTKLPPATGGGAGLRFPQAGNNDNSYLRTFSTQGFAVGVEMGEHAWIDRASVVLCYDGVHWPGATPDGAGIGSLSTEACARHISTAGTTGSGGARCCLTVIDWSIEDETDLVTIAHVYDPNQVLYGGALTCWRNKTSSGAAPDSGVVVGSTYQPPIFTGGMYFAVNDRRMGQRASAVATAGCIVETPEAHGAVRDGTTDDTAAIQLAINFAIARGQADGSNYAEVWFSSGIYVVAGTPTGHGTPNFANSQVVLPLITSGSSTQKFTLVLKGPKYSGMSLPHWNQTVGQKEGAILKTTATGTNDTTNGQPSVIGGPTNAQGYGGGAGNSWSNMLVIVEGLRVLAPAVNPTMSGFNFEGILQAKVAAGYLCDATPSAMNTQVGGTWNAWTYGLRMPTTGNNDLCVVDDWSAEGVYHSIWVCEHAHVRDMRSVYCYVGLTADNRISTPHFAQVDFASIEYCHDMIELSSSSGNCKLIARIADESGGKIWDGNSLLYGEITLMGQATVSRFDWAASTGRNVIGNWSSTPTNGQFIRLHDMNTLPGAGANQPTVPASGTAFYNLSCHDCAVTIAGTGLTNVVIDGQTMVTVPGTFIVPEGKAITLIYTGTVTWNWMLL